MQSSKIRFIHNNNNKNNKYMLNVQFSDQQTFSMTVNIFSSVGQTVSVATSM